MENIFQDCIYKKIFVLFFLNDEIYLANLLLSFQNIEQKLLF